MKKAKTSKVDLSKLVKLDKNQLKSVTGGDGSTPAGSSSIVTGMASGKRQH